MEHTRASWSHSESLGETSWQQLRRQGSCEQRHGLQMEEGQQTHLKERWAQRRSLRLEEGWQPHLQEPQLPAPLAGGRCLKSATLCEDLPSPAALHSWLCAHGLDPENWDQKKGKGVEDLWKEVQQQECGLELWQTAAGEVRPVRVVHVLRAKVCSPQSYERNIFLFNTWQQSADGRMRTRNRLLSEKLSVAEMPLQDHLHEVCHRAVTLEEMQRLDGAALRIGPGHEPVEYDPNYVCPVTVLDEQYVEHGVEVVDSFSYPNLLTKYHLYTVEMVCLGLPTVDFTSLEFENPNEAGHRQLKYVHGWAWLEWSHIRRYLFEGSELKDRKVKGSFGSAEDLTSWLSQFDLELSAWGKGPWKSAGQLFKQVESGDTHLEHWGRHDGAPLLMRVLHVIRLEIHPTDPRLLGKFLLQRWQQEAHGAVRVVNRLMTKTMNTLGIPFDEQRLKEVAAQTIQEKLAILVDAHFNLSYYSSKMLEGLEPSGVQIVKATLVDHQVSIDESPSYKDLCTLYHLYNMQVECQGLPVAPFSSITFESSLQPGAGPNPPQVRVCQGFEWMTWPSCIDVWQGQAATDKRRVDALMSQCTSQQEDMMTSYENLLYLRKSLDRLVQRNGLEEDPDLLESQQLLQELQATASLVAAGQHEASSQDDLSVVLPPSMVSQMSEHTIVPKQTLETAMLRRMRWNQKIADLEREDLETEVAPGDLTVRSLASAGGCSSGNGHVDLDQSRARFDSAASQVMERVEESFATAVMEEDGTILEAELEGVLRSISPDLTTRSIRRIIAAIHPNKQEALSYRDFIRWLYSDQT